jgi:hypothetical protein
MLQQGIVQSGFVIITKKKIIAAGFLGIAQLLWRKSL